MLDQPPGQQAVPAELVLPYRSWSAAGSRLTSNTSRLLHQLLCLIERRQERVAVGRAAPAGEMVVHAARNALRRTSASAVTPSGKAVLRGGLPSPSVMLANFGPRNAASSARAAGAAGRYVNVARQRRIRRREQLRPHGPQVRIVGHGLLPPAGRHAIGSLAVVVFLGVDAAHQGQVMHLLGRVGQQLADVHARHGSGNGAERSAGVGLGLGIPAFQLAQAAGHPDHENVFLIRRQLGQGRREARGENRASPRRLPRPKCPRSGAALADARPIGRRNGISWRGLP